MLSNPSHQAPSTAHPSVKTHWAAPADKPPEKPSLTQHNVEPKYLHTQNPVTQ